ncbi:hypothetical protein QTO34_015411 [Cnephaeus nilssonii]|uniref:Uncharacterized protein n=1 Tax=Cnephaeus nilssonii TaxID=3371016 RepID=A0AA40LR68_CNENI|nr:hypothetical protein QTO34_015411 [Eptesicus nilssonii]
MGKHRGGGRGAGRSCWWPASSQDQLRHISPRRPGEAGVRHHHVTRSQSFCPTVHLDKLRPSVRERTRPSVRSGADTGPRSGADRPRSGSGHGLVRSDTALGRGADTALGRGADTALGRGADTALGRERTRASVGSDTALGRERTRPSVGERTRPSSGSGHALVGDGHGPRRGRTRPSSGRTRALGRDGHGPRSGSGHGPSVGERTRVSAAKGRLELLRHWRGAVDRLLQRSGEGKAPKQPVTVKAKLSSRRAEEKRTGIGTYPLTSEGPHETCTQGSNGQQQLVLA